MDCPRSPSGTLADVHRTLLYGGIFMYPADKKSREQKTKFIASTPMLFPAEYVKEFQSCLGKTPPVPFEKIKAIIRDKLGRPLEEVYDYIDLEPLASASIAQVHAAKLKQSRKDVVIKVLKPGVEDILTVDLNFIYITEPANQSMTLILPQGMQPAAQPQPARAPKTPAPPAIAALMSVPESSDWQEHIAPDGRR